MPRTLKSPEQRKKPIGVSLPMVEVDRFDALAETTYPNGGEGKRSQFIAEAIFLGLERRFGPNWRELADQMRQSGSVEGKAA